MDVPRITPQTFRRHRRPLRAFLMGHEAWFAARDLRRLLNADINPRPLRRWLSQEVLARLRGGEVLAG